MSENLSNSILGKQLSVSSEGMDQRDILAEVAVNSSTEQGDLSIDRYMVSQRERIEDKQSSAVNADLSGLNDSVVLSSGGSAGKLDELLRKEQELEQRLLESTDLVSQASEDLALLQINESLSKINAEVVEKLAVKTSVSETPILNAQSLATQILLKDDASGAKAPLPESSFDPSEQKAAVLQSKFSAAQSLKESAGNKKSAILNELMELKAKIASIRQKK
jgi:hypothetical protein